MKKTSKKWTLALAVVTLVAMIAAGQNPPTQPKPDPAMEKLKYFLGDWKEKGTMKPDPKSPGDKFTGTYHNVMMHGGFFLEMHETGDVVGPGQGKFTSVAFIGYNAGEKVKYFLGDWKEKGTMKPDPKSPGDKFTGTYHNVMMHGGFFLEMHETGDVVGLVHL